MKQFLIVGLLLVGSPANAATAILCNTTTVYDHAASSSDPNASKETTLIDTVFVIDDAAKSVTRLNKLTDGYDAICSECEIKFGPSQITALWFPPFVSPNVINYIFTLDRVKGTVKSDMTNFNMDTGSKNNSVMTGTCSKIVMPKSSGPKAKF